MLDFISQSWPWYVAGPMIALVMFLLLLAGGNFGVSSTLRTFCTIGSAGKHSSFFDFDYKSQIWNVVFILSAAIGGYIATNYLSDPESLQLSQATIDDLSALNINFDGGLAPTAFFSWDSLMTIKGFLMLVVGGFLVGFGTRWAGGCTSGHAISGLSNL